MHQLKEAVMALHVSSPIHLGEIDYLRLFQPHRLPLTATSSTQSAISYD